MQPLDVAIFLFRIVYFAIWLVPWSIYIIYRFTQVKWALFTKKEHKMPERLIKEYNHKYIQLSEVKIHYVEEGDNSKPLLLFVHGFPEFWYTWRYQIKHFAKTHHVVAIDQRGYGDSDKPEGAENYEGKKMAGDVKEIIQRLGHEKGTVVGHDWGGAVAWLTALIYPEVVSKLVVMNCPHPGVFEKIMKAYPKQILKSWYIMFFQNPCLPEFALGLNDYDALDFAFRSKAAGMKNPQYFTDEDLEAWKATFSKKGALTPPINYYRGLVRNRSEAVNIVNRVCKPPTLVIWGKDDPFLHIECPAYSEKMCLKGKVEYVDNSSHWVQQDQPEVVNKLLEKFIN